MHVKLAPRQPYWMLLDQITRKVKYHLSFASPGPVEINEEALAPAEKQTLQAALRYGILQVAEPVHEDQAQAPESIDLSYLVTEDPVWRAQNILQANVQKCLTDIDQLVKTHDLAVLEAMQQLETQGKNQYGTPRKTILAALERAIQLCSGTTQIIESDQEEVTIRLDNAEQEYE